MILAILALAAAAPLVPARARPDWLEAPTYAGEGCLRWDPDPVGERRLLATGDGAALVTTKVGTFGITVDAGVEALYPPDVSWAGIGDGGLPYAIVDGRLAPYGQRGGLRAELADVAPGLRVVARDRAVEVWEEPSGKRLTRIALAQVQAVHALPDGRAVVDFAGEELALWNGRVWSRIPRPEGTLTRHGGQLRAGTLALDTSGAWRESGRGSDDAVRWWLDQLGGDGRPVDRTARRVDSGFPVAPQAPGPKESPIKKSPLLLQLIGTSGNTGHDVVSDILGDDAQRTPTWEIAPRDDWREWYPRVQLLNDGVRDGDRQVRPPHVLYSPKDAPAQLVDVPRGCVPKWADGRAGLPVLRCQDGGIYTRGDTWMREAVVSGGLVLGDDGTLLAVAGDTAWVRPPEGPGAVWARVEQPGVTAWRPGPGGTAIALTLSGTELAVHVYDRDGLRGHRVAPLRAETDTGVGVPPGWLDVQTDADGLAVVRLRAQRDRPYTEVVYRFTQ